MFGKGARPAIHFYIELDSKDVPGLDYPVRAYSEYWFYPDNTCLASLTVSAYTELENWQGEVILHKSTLVRAATYGVLVLAAQGAERLLNWFLEQSPLELRTLYQWHLLHGDAKDVSFEVYKKGVTRNG